MRAALERGDWDEVGRRSPTSGTTASASRPASRRRRSTTLIARATRRRRHGGQGVRRRRRRLPVLLRPAGRGAPRSRAALAAGGARAARLPHRTSTVCAWITAAIARVLARDRGPARDQGREPFKIRAYRNGRRHRSPTMPDAGRAARRRRSCARFPASARISPAGSASWPRPAPAAITGAARRSSRRRCSICCACRASGRRPWRLLYRELGIRTLDELAAAARDGRLRALKGMGAKKEALILKAHRGAAARRRPAPAGRRARRSPPTLHRATCASARRTSRSSPVGSLRRGCETCGDIDILAAGARRRR